MKHIKTPIQMTCLGDLIDADKDPLADLQGNYASDDLPRAAEIVQAVNEHDDLVAQRDGLLAALKAQESYEQHVSKCPQCDWSETYCETGWILWNTAQNMRAIAIAEVEGEREAE